MADNKKKKRNYCSRKKLSPGKVSNNINKIFSNYNNINDMILFLSEHFFITSKISCPSSTLKGKVYTLTRKIIFFSIFLQRNSLSQKRLIFGLLFLHPEPVPAFVCNTKQVATSWVITYCISLKINFMYRKGHSPNDKVYKLRGH